MADRPSTRYPQIVAGTCLLSGTPNTGQQSWTQGGQLTFACSSGSSQTGLSGVLAVQIQPGAGRLDTIQMLGFAAAVPQAASGQLITFYDAAVVGTGFVPASGHKLLAVLDARGNAATVFGNLTFNSGALIYSTPVQSVGLPFNSGLNVAAASGSPGWTCSFTPVVSN